jgi:predicted Zn-dependent protease
VNGSLVRERVLTVLDLLLVNDPSPGVRAVLRAADPGPYRDAVRDALAAGDRPGVAALAGRPDALDQPVWFAAALGDNVAVPADRRRAVLENALRTRAGDPILLTTLGHSYPRGWPEVAGERARWFQAALAAQPGHPSTLVSLGNALLDQGDPVRAIAECREAIRPAPEFALAHSNLGMALWQKGDRDGAYAEYREAIRLDPELADGHFNLAVALWLHKGTRTGRSWSSGRRSGSTRRTPSPTSIWGRSSVT